MKKRENGNVTPAARLDRPLIGTAVNMRDSYRALVRLGKPPAKAIVIFYGDDGQTLETIERVIYADAVA